MDKFNYNPSKPRGTVDFNLHDKHKEVLESKIKICFSHVRSYGDFKWDNKQSKANGDKKVKFVKFMEPIMYVSNLTPEQFISICNNANEKRLHHIHCYYEKDYEWKKAFRLEEIGMGPDGEAEQMDAYQFGVGDFARFLGIFVGNHFLVRVIDTCHKFCEKYKIK